MHFDALVLIKRPSPHSTPSITQLVPAFLSFLIIYSMQLSQERCTYTDNGMSHMSLDILTYCPYVYLQSPPSVPVRSRSPPPRAGAHQARPSTPQPYVSSDELYSDFVAHEHAFSSPSSSQSLPRDSSPAAKVRRPLPTQQPIRRYTSWHTFHSCAACLAL
jgi:hypothetical protein